MSQHGWQYLTDADKEAIIRGAEDGAVYGGPFHLELDWVDKCNAKCYFCSSEYIHQGAVLAWGRAQEILEEARGAGLRSIRLAGGGEPTLHAQSAELFRWMAANKIVLDNLTTNGTMFTEAFLEALVGLEVGEVRISLNYADEATYAEGMGLPPKFFGRVVAMAEDMQAARRGKPNFGKFILQFFVCRSTLNQIRMMYDLGLRLGADVISFRELHGIDPEKNYAESDVPQIVADLAEVLRDDWSESRVEPNLWSRGAGPAMQRLMAELEAELGPRAKQLESPSTFEDKYCYMPWYSMAIMGSQTVYPCCFYVGDESNPALDSLAGKSLAEVWTGGAYQRMRKEMRDFILLTKRVPFFSRRNKFLMPGCASHCECGLTHSLAEDFIYADADARMEKVRRQPAVAAWRAANLAAGG